MISTPTFSSSGIVIDHNTFIDNGSAGIHLDLIFTAGVDVRDNVFTKNGFRPRLRPRVAGGTVEPNDGISAYGLMTGVSPNPLIFSGLTGVTLSGNKAMHNADLGIEAAGSVGGGHNRAEANGNKSQCVGVVC